MVAVLSRRNGQARVDPESVELPADVFLGRQPILDRRQQLWGYELLYRGDGQSNVADVDDAYNATATVVINLLSEIGLDQMVGNARMLINCPMEVLDLEILALLPREQVILEVLETVVCNDENVGKVRRLADEGYSIALDDFGTDDPREEMLPHSRYVKVDLTLVKPENLASLVEQLKRHSVTLLAEKVETREEFEICRELGFELFQGYYFCQPEIVKGRRPPASQVAVMRLLSKANDPETTTEELSRLVSVDVGLSFRLLRCLNSAAFSLAREVQTVEHAMMLLGETRFRQWVSMLAVSGIPDKPTELSRVALLRAHMCELLADKLGRANIDSKAVFTVGLFSVLDAMLNVEMSKILKELPLTQPVRDALLGKPGVLGCVISAVLSYERGSWTELASLGMKPEELTAIWIEATRTMEQSYEQIRAQNVQAQGS